MTITHDTHVGHTPGDQLDPADDTVRRDSPAPRRHRVGWAFATLALAATTTLAVTLVAGDDDGPARPLHHGVGDAKDHLGYGGATPVVADNSRPLHHGVGDAKDHLGYGGATPVVADYRRPLHHGVGDAKDHPGYGPVTPAAEFVGDAKDHPGYGSLTPAAEFVGDAKDHLGYGPVTPAAASGGD